MFSRVGAGFFRLMELVRIPSIGHFGLVGVLAAAQFCTINPYVSFWIRLSHYAGLAHATVVLFQGLWRKQGATETEKSHQAAEHGQLFK
jgi:hypothetical protein